MKPTVDKDLSQMAKDCLREVNGDREKAMQLLYTKLTDDQKNQLLSSYLDTAIRKLLLAVTGTRHTGGEPSIPQNESSKNEPPPPHIAAPTNPGAGLMRLARRNLETLMDNFRLSTGPLLGDATSTQLLEEAAAEYEAAKIRTERMMFLKQVADKVGNGVKVRTVLDNVQIKQIAMKVNYEVWS